MPQEQRPVVPEAPDPYEADYSDRLQAYTEAVGKAATYDTLQQGRIEAENRRNQEAAYKLKQTWLDRAQEYTERASELKITPQQLQDAGGVIANYQLKDEVTAYIMDRKKDGPTIATYLAANTGELDALSRMTPTEASVHVATVIAPKASASQGISGAPDPADSLSGGGAPPTQRGPKGATYT